MFKRGALLLTAMIVATACGGSGNSNSTPSTVPLVKNATRAPAAPTTLPPMARPTTTTRSPATTTTKAPAATTVTTLTPTTFPTMNSGSCTTQGPCRVGQTGPAGGIVFYVAPTPQKWGQYLEVRPGAFEQISPDTCNLDAYNTYATGKIGDGITQTAAVISACAKDGKPSNAGSYARVNAHTQNGFGNWFIPSKDELQALLDSKVINFPTDKDVTSGTWVNKPMSSSSRGFDVLYGVKKETLAGTAPSSRGGTVRNVEVMSDGSQSYGNPNNRWGWIYIARAFGPKS